MTMIDDYDKEVPISELVGKTVLSISGLYPESEEVILTLSDNCRYTFKHIQDCCENVRLEDYEVYSKSLIGSTILSAEESTSSEEEPHEYSESWKWTFYIINTTSGGLWMRWLGESNGYYSESVNILKDKIH